MARYSEAEWKPLPETKTQTRIAPRAIGLHTAVSNADSLWDYFNRGSEDDVETECHFYVPEDTKIEQYIDTNVMAHCQVDGNPFVISYETWDGAGDVWEPPNWKDIPALNDHQIDEITSSWAWASTVHNIPLRPMRFWNDSGVGYHRQFVGRPGWTRGYRDCPGDRKIKQIPELIALSIEKRDGMAITNEDIQKIVDANRSMVREEIARELDRDVTSPEEYPPVTTVDVRRGGRYSWLGYVRIVEVKSMLVTVRATQAAHTALLERLLNQPNIPISEGEVEQIVRDAVGNALNQITIGLKPDENVDEAP